MSKKVYITTFGCNRRLLEASKIQNYLYVNGYKIVPVPTQADLIILSTCAFKEKEEDLSVSFIRKYKQYNAELLVFGCLPNIAPNKFNAFNNLKFLTPKDLHKIDTFFDDIKVKYSEISDIHHITTTPKQGIIQKMFVRLDSGELFSREYLLTTMLSFKKGITGLLNKANRRYYLFVCRGCLGMCSYCAIKRSVGTVVSEPLNKILENFRKGYWKGYRKFIILGDDPGCYGIDINTNFPKLLSALNEEAKKLCAEQAYGKTKHQKIALHINEIHPKFLLMYQKDIIEICKTGIIMSILCPMQSGSTKILQLMQREHSAEELSNCLRKLRKINPDLRISTQVIVGFPTEKEEDFQDTLNLILEIGFYLVILFPYHKKEYTPAAQLEGELLEQIIQERLKYGLKYLRKQGVRAYTRCLT